MEAELRSLIVAKIERHERSQQRMIGASEVGTPCPRKLAMKLAQVDPVPEQVNGEDSWRATVGTAVHDWLADMLEQANAAYWQEPWNLGSPDDECPHKWCPEGQHIDRWLIERRVPVGTIDGVPIDSTLDVFDRLSHTLVDWKVPGPTAIKGYRQARDPGPQYRTQVQLYGRGLHAAGEEVRWVGIMFLPSNGELKQAYYWEEEFDVKIGNEALKRAREIQRLVDDGRPFTEFKTVDDHCHHCPFFSPGSTDDRECPGDDSLLANVAHSFADILPPDTPIG